MWRKICYISSGVRFRSFSEKNYRYVSILPKLLIFFYFFCETQSMKFSFSDVGISKTYRCIIFCSQKCTFFYFSTTAFEVNILSHTSQSVCSDYGMFHSHLNYNILLWGSSMSVNRILIGQKRVLRMIFWMRFPYSCRPLFVHYKIMTVPSI